MIDCPHTLKGHPILEPNHLFLASRSEPVYEESLDEIGHDLPAFMRHVSDGVICGNGSACPHNDVRYAWSEAVGPVIHENAVVGWVLKRDTGSWSEGWFAPGLGEPMGNEKVGYVAILGFCLGSPLDVPPKIGWLSLEKMEIVVL